MEMFNTIQGEGLYAGHAAYFVRLGGCDVGCHWCDVKESWDAGLHPTKSVGEIAKSINSYESSIVVVTGGEPLMYDLQELTAEIKSGNRRTHVETAGVHPLSGDWDWICFSPKKFKKPLNEYYDAAHELKVVIFHKNDFEWAESHAARMNSEAKLFLQVEWSKREVLMPLIVDYVKANPKWAISVQTHKYLNIP